MDNSQIKPLSLFSRDELIPLCIVLCLGAALLVVGVGLVSDNFLEGLGKVVGR